MLRILSTYPFVLRKLTPELLGQISGAGFEALEIFFSRGHFDYTTKSEIQAMAGALQANHLKLLSVHAPNSRDISLNREGGAPLSICEVERTRRIDAMDELKRAIDVAEDLPFERMVLHMGGARETADPRKRDAAFSTLEHLILHARHVGVTITVENTTSEMGHPAYLRAFVDETRLFGLRFNFDIGHANLTDVISSSGHDSRILCAFEPLRDALGGVHLHDNHGDKDEHLPPYEGSIDWPTAISYLQTAPNARSLPLTLELKEKTGPDATGAAELLANARASMERFEKAWG